jgi:nicotinamide phosphoribosyltransferase
MLHYLTEQVMEDDVLYAEKRFAKYYGDERIFNKAGWMHIVEDHNGFLPIRIKSAPEGMVIPTHNVLMTIENTCPKCAWVTNYVESLLLKVWYPITVATLSREIKKIDPVLLGEERHTRWSPVEAARFRLQGRF